MIERRANFLTRHRNLNWALADQIIVSGANFLTALLLARYLGLEEFGRFTLAWMAILFANSIQHAMIIAPMMSIGPKQTAADTPAYYGAVAAQQVGIAVFSFLLLWLGALVGDHYFSEWRAEGLALPLATAAFAFQMQDWLRRYFFTLGRGCAAFVNDAIRYLGQLAILVWYFQIPTIESSQVLWIIAGTAVVATSIGLLHIEKIEWKSQAFHSTISHNWKFSKWLISSALMQWGSGNFFILVAGVLLGTAAVGALKAAQTLLGVTHILFQGLENIVPVQAARHFHEGGKKALYDYLIRVTLLGGGATAAVAGIVAAAPDFLLGHVFGDQYIGYGYLVQWFAVIYLLIFLGLPLRSGLHAIEHTKTIFRAYLWMTVFTMLAAYPMVKFFSLSGVQFGILVTQFISVSTMLNGLKYKLT